MRILHILDHSIPLHSGYSFRTLAILREQRALGWETFHLTSPKHYGAQADEERIDGWHFYRSPSIGTRSLPGFGELGMMRAIERRLLEIAPRIRPDVLHAHSPVLDVLPALRVGRRLRLPVVYEVRAFWEDAAVDHGTTHEGSLRYRLTRGMETYALRRAHHVTAICEGLRSDIVARGIPAHKVTVIPNAVDVGAFSTSGEPDEALKAKLRLGSRTVIGFIGSFYAYEGLDLLLSALPRIVAKVPDAMLLLVGGGPQESALKDQARQMGVGDKVIFAGRVPHEEVQAYYDLIDVLAYPRRSMRLTDLVTPLKPLEAMAQGRVLVASDVGGHRELIRDGTTGMLFRAGSADSLAEAVLTLLDQRAGWPEFRRAARRFVENERTWTASVARYREIYASLVGQDRRIVSA